MKKAYYKLKSLQNLNLYGNESLIAGNTDFTNDISFKLIGRINGKASIDLLDEKNKIVTHLEVNTESGEVYDENLSGLNDLPIGEYTLQYSDGVNSKKVKLNKQFVSIQQSKNKPVTISAEY